MTQATNSVLIKNANWITFTIKRKSNEADVERFKNGHAETWESIPIKSANELYTQALADGYKVAF